MAVSNLIAGAISLAAANWESSLGFAAAAELTIGSGSQNIVNDMTQTANTILSLTIEQEFAGNLGTAASPALFNASDGSAAEKTSANTEGFLLNRGSGSVFVAGNIDNVIQAGSGTLTLGAGTYTWVAASAGRIVCLPGAVIVNLKVHGGSVEMQAASSTNTSTITQWGGSVICKRPVSVGAGTIIINAGSFTYAYDNSTGTATTAVTLNGGTFYHKAGPITTLNHNAGMHDYSAMYRTTDVATCIRTPTSRFVGNRSGGKIGFSVADRTTGFPVFTG